MAQDKQTSYFRIGGFVITGIILLVITILVFGSGQLFKRVVYVETYFNESVQGLVEGSPVKYLGMQIGNVAEINSVESIYNLHGASKEKGYNRYIYVKMALVPKFYANRTKEEIEKYIKRSVAAGLRVRLAPQGLTGNVYVELDFVNPNARPPLPIAWRPELCYIPSTTSTLTYFTDNLEKLLNNLKNIDFDKLAKNVQRLLNSTNDVMHKTDRLFAQTSEQMIGVVNNLQGMAENLNGLSEQAKAFPSHIIFGKPPPPLDPGKL